MRNLKIQVGYTIWPSSQNVLREFFLRLSDILFSLNETFTDRFVDFGDHKALFRIFYKLFEKYKYTEATLDLEQICLYCRDLLKYESNIFSN
jgi:hypothetical protein